MRDWNNVIYKNVRTKDMKPVGNITAVDDRYLIINTQGCLDNNLLPKTNVQEYNGGEVILGFVYAELPIYRYTSHG